MTINEIRSTNGPESLDYAKGVSDFNGFYTSLSDADRDRVDGIVRNTLLKLGSDRDVEQSHEPDRLKCLTPEQLEELYSSDSMAQRVCTLLAGRMKVGGIHVMGLTKEEPRPKEPKNKGRRQTRAGANIPPTKKPKSENKAVHRYIRQSGILDACWKASILSSIYWKGAGILLEVDDGRQWFEPVDEDNIKSVKIAFVAEGRYVQPVYGSGFHDSPSWFNVAGLIESGALDHSIREMTKQGQMMTLADLYSSDPERLEERRSEYAESSIGNVHPSRVLWFKGVYTPPAVLQREGSISRLQLFWTHYRRYEASMAAAANILHRMEVLNLQREGLVQTLAKAENDPTVRQNLENELETIFKGLHTLGVAFSDKSKHTIDIVRRSLAGIPEIIKENKNCAIAASDLTEIDLWGTTNQGTGLANNDLRERMQTAAKVASRQEEEWRIPLEIWLRYTFKSSDGPTKGAEPEEWDLDFPSTLELTPQERAELRSKQANTDKIYIELAVLDKKEVRASRFGSGQWSPETSLDPDLDPDKIEAPKPAADNGQGSEAGGKGARNGQSSGDGITERLQALEVVVDNLASRKDGFRVDNKAPAYTPSSVIDIQRPDGSSIRRSIERSRYSLLIFDADGTLRSSPNMYPRNSDDWRLRTNVKEWFAALHQTLEPWQELAIASNQGGIAYGEVDEPSAVTALVHTYRAILPKHRPVVGAMVRYCPTADPNDPDRKPNPGMLEDLIEGYISLKGETPDCLMVGDQVSDLEAAAAAGIDFAWAGDVFGPDSLNTDSLNADSLNTDATDKELLTEDEWATMADFDDQDRKAATDSWDDTNA